jgi:hypothetical protein
VCGDITKATKATKDADGFAQTAVDAQKLAGQKFDGAKALLTDYTTLSADKCLEQVTSATVTAETDADGLFKIKVPKKGRFIILASTQRAVGNSTERYFWIVPFSLEGDSSANIRLSNDNELFVPDGSGAKVIDLRSKALEHQWHRYAPDGSFEEGPNSAPTAPTSPPIPAGAPSITTP